MEIVKFTYTEAHADLQDHARIGSALAFLTQASLVISVQTAHVQWLWRSLKRTTISVDAIDSGFNVNQNLWSFTNFEMVSKLKLASSIALVAWLADLTPSVYNRSLIPRRLLPIGSVITPATLGVEPILQAKNLMVNVSSLEISQPDYYRFFAYFVSRQDAKGNGMQKFLGARTLPARLAVAAASTGEILAITPPFTNTTYEQNFFGPYVKCRKANSSTKAQIDATNERRRLALDPVIKEIQNYYWAYVPDLGRINGNKSSSSANVANLSEENGALHASNQLWLRYPHPNNDNITSDLTQPIHPQYLVCELHNASYEVNFTWTNGLQLLNITSIEILNSTPYPVNSTYSGLDEDIMAYSAYMNAFSSQLTGSIGFYQDLNGTRDVNNEAIANRSYGEVDTNLQRTLLLGAVEFNPFFIKNHALAGNKDLNKPYSVARLQDMSLARNRTLDVLIEELSANITLSLISNPLLSSQTMTNVTTNTPINVYTYHRRNLFIAYGIALFFALVANFIGAFAYFSNGESHDNTFSAIVCSTRDIHIANMNVHERSGALPLNPNVAKMQIKYGEGSDGDGTWGFRIER